jgi:hypothetical protein
MKIEIYDKATNEVLETKEIRKLEPFLFYWCSQCNTKQYGWREVKE